MRIRAAQTLSVLLLAALVSADTAVCFDASNVVLGSATIECAFTPGDAAAELIVPAINTAGSQVLVQAFSLIREESARAPIGAKRHRVDVQIIAGREQIELIEHNVIPRLAEAGVPVFTDAEHSAAPNKIMVIEADARTPMLLTGSFNFTFAAQFHNAENLLVFRGNGELARACLRQLEASPQRFDGVCWRCRRVT